MSARIEPFACSLWDTAQLIRGLVAAGVSASDPRLCQAAHFLADHQTTRASPRDWQTPPPGALTSGGWPFQPGNELNPDLDSTQEVLGAIALVANDTRDRRLRAAVDRGRAFLLAMQNANGGWAAFSHGKPGHFPGALHVPARPLPVNAGVVARARQAVTRVVSTLGEIGDPSAAGVTARTISTLALIGESPRSAAIRKAIEFVHYQRTPAIGVWWGRWAVNYVPTTCYVLSGLAKAGVDAGTPWVRHAIEWLCSKQNDNGGWGETVESYERPELAGCGPSMRSLTAYGLWALSDVGRANSNRAIAAIRYLIGHQRDDGSWGDTAPQGVLMPGIGYYTNDTFSTYVALEGLGAWLRQTKS